MKTIWSQFFWNNQIFIRKEFTLPIPEKADRYELLSLMLHVNPYKLFQGNNDVFELRYIVWRKVLCLYSGISYISEPGVGIVWVFLSTP